MLSPISRNPNVMSGAYCIRGTRIPAWLIQNFNRNGMSARRIVKFYDGRYTVKQIQAAIDFRKKRRAK